MDAGKGLDHAAAGCIDLAALALEFTVSRRTIGGSELADDWNFAPHARDGREETGDRGPLAGKESRRNDSSAGSSSRPFCIHTESCGSLAE
jgi:hypothetical protein